ncbi:hypothetical protein [Pseudomonas sp. KNUC1026]|uniref:hypothetical protein n=1 Tax=Pseudomonas sp. KNUC1026 TaxID=2893890 RepID=UPI001F44AAEC|nr:hypothetical protein [Pseudomonas sp. KNUC1026]UFH50264.1 hypothetical protein LN139_02860 [Pseudomonas sp. KNUC1026]
MESTASKPWYSTRPAPVFMAAFYCLLVFIQAAFWVIGEGWEKARQGDISFLALLNVCVVALFLFVGGWLLFKRKRACSLFFVSALVLGIALIALQSRGVSIWYLLALPMFKEYALILGIWVYSLQLRGERYYRRKPVAEPSAT